MGVALESARFIKARWDLAEEDFRRILSFALLLALALAVYVFTTNEEGGGLSGMFHARAGRRDDSQHRRRRASAFLRWLPMTLFLFIAAQMFSERGDRSADGHFAVPALATAAKGARRAGAQCGHFVSVFHGVPVFGGHPHQRRTQTYFWGQMRFDRVGVVVAAFAAVSASSSGWARWCWRWRSAFRRARHRADGAGHSKVSTRSGWRISSGKEPIATQSITAIGQIGDLKLSPRIVIRLEPKNGSPPPIYLREASYRSYQFANLARRHGGK